MSHHIFFRTNRVFIIVGLGNPGLQYKKTRHNVGFMVLDVLAKRHKLSFTAGKGPFVASYFFQKRNKIWLIKPVTFMNISGQAVQSVTSYHRINDYSKLLIISDDINLPFGTLRMRPYGSDGGQKGLKSIISLLRTQNFPRLRIGIGNEFTNAAKYVLSSFEKSEREELPFILNWAADAVESFIVNGSELTMSRFNRNFLTN